jgi:hypothetical protein
MPSPGRCGVTPIRPHKDGPPAGVPVRLSHLPPGWDPFGPGPIQLSPRSHQIPPHLPRPSLPSWSDRADSDTLDIRYIQSRRSGSISSYFWTLHAFCSSSAKSFQLKTGFTRCPFGFASCNCPSNFSPSSRSPILARTPPYLSITLQVCTGTPLLALPLSLLVWLLSLDSDTDSDEPCPPPPGQLTLRIRSLPSLACGTLCPDQRSLLASLCPLGHHMARTSARMLTTSHALAGTHSRRRANQ